MIDLISSFLGPSDDEPLPGNLQQEKQRLDQDSGIESVEPDGPFRIIIFSKDRPWQLQQLLRSMHLEDSFRGSSCGRLLHIFIIYKVTETYESGYKKVKKDCESRQWNITWYQECDVGFHYDSSEKEYERIDSQKNSFANLLEAALKRPLLDSQPDVDVAAAATRTNAPAQVLGMGNLVMFLTDDCILLEPIHAIASTAINILNKGDTRTSKRILGFLTRLHPGITYCQTKDEASPPPRSHLVYQETSTELKAFVYPECYGSNDFSYPFDLSGGIYHQTTVVELLEEMQRFHSPNNEEKVMRGGGSQNMAYAHPNTLEIHGNNSIRRMKNESRGRQSMNDDNQSLSMRVKEKDLLAIPSHPTLLILAINRVQDICQAPIATGEESGIAGKTSHSPESLLEYLEDGKHLDLSRYKSKTFNSSHIGDLHVQQQHALENQSEFSRNMRTSYALSVLIPVHVGPPLAAGTAMESILLQIMDDSSALIPIQIVLVDDRCTDGSIDEMQNLARSFSRENNQSLNIRDHRKDAKSGILRQIINSSITIDIVGSPSPGISAALNAGLEICQADFVARMDADDIACPRRLVKQLRHLRNNSNLQVLGTNCISFAESSLSSQSKANRIALPFEDRLTVSNNLQHELLRSSIEPTDAGFVAWSMMFSCVIVHPSVMFRKKNIVNIEGYSPNVEYAEDYDLWVRLIDNNFTSVCSLPMIGVLHRKHSCRSSSDDRSQTQREEAAKVSRRAMTTFHDASISLEVVKTLKYPNEAEDRSLLDNAADLLCALEKGFIKKVGIHLSKNEIDLVVMDCDARLGELATLSIDKFGCDATNGKAWSLWCEKCPNLQIERLALLLRAKRALSS